MRKNKKVAVGLSGGVDSAVSAYLLKRKGFLPIGFSLQLCSNISRHCDSSNMARIKELCSRLDIAHQVIDARDLFKKEIVSYFIDSYLKGLTPNPCAYCNRIVKLGFLLDKVKSLGIDYLATGHYARIARYKGHLCLKRGRDLKKTQDYFLSLIKPSALSSMIFPLGSYTKEQVRKIARDKKIICPSQEESQDICFTASKSYPCFIEENIKDSYKYSGDIKHVSGKILGRHKGIYYYTLGQRAGLGIGWKEPLYVVDIDAETKIVTVGERAFLRRKEFCVESLNWFVPARDYKNIKVKIRYNSPFYGCSLQMKESKVVVRLKKEVEAVTAGQIAAFYQRDKLAGAGIIAR